MTFLFIKEKYKSLENKVMWSYTMMHQITLKLNVTSKMQLYTGVQIALDDAYFGETFVEKNFL